MNKNKLKKILKGISRSDELKDKKVFKKLADKLRGTKKVTEIKEQIQSLFEYITNLKKDLKKSEDEKMSQLKSMMAEYRIASLERLGTLSAEMDDVKKDIQEISQRKVEIPNFESQIKKFENELKKVTSKSDLNDTKKKVSELEEEIKKLRRDTMSAMARGGNMNRNILVGSNPSTLGRYTDLNILAGTNVTLSHTNNDNLKTTDLTIAATGTIDGSGVANEIAYWVDTNTLGSLAVATYPSLTELSYVKGVTSAIQTQINAKFTLPTLTSGSVLFSDGTTIAQDNANFFWDDTNNRLGLGTAVPTSRLHLVQTATDTSGDALMSNFALTVNPASASSANFYAAQATLVTSGSSALSGNIFGFRANVSAQNTGGSTGDIAGLSFSVTQVNASGTLDKVYGLVGQAVRTGAGTTTLAIGVLAEVDRTAGTVATAIGVRGSAKNGTANFGLYALNGGIGFAEETVTPADPTSSNEMRMYLKADTIVFQFNDAGTVRYKSLVLSGTTVTWVASTTPP